MRTAIAESKPKGLAASYELLSIIPLVVGVAGLALAIVLALRLPATLP
jgi:hypothetical protein